MRYFGRKVIVISSKNLDDHRPALLECVERRRAVRAAARFVERLE
jgi:hypothetical protein